MSSEHEAACDVTDAARKSDGGPPLKRPALGLIDSVIDSPVIDYTNGPPRYRMDHPRRGKFIIINNMKFQPQTGQSERRGSQVDADNLKDDFELLGFKVAVHTNQTTDEMEDIASAAAKDDHTDCDSFGMAVLTHGDDSILFAVDGIITIEDFLAPIKRCTTLAGKPKIFIFQACRGNKFDKGVDAVDSRDAVDAPQRKRIPVEADYLYAYSTVPGFFAWRNQVKGSWFVQALHKLIQDNIFKIDFMKLLTWVNHEVAYEFTSNGEFSGMKQVPSIVSTLTKDLYFTRRNIPL